jgi:hypothetical protein
MLGLAAPRLAVMAVHNIGCIAMVKALMPEEPSRTGLNSSLSWFETERSLSIRAPMHSFAPTLVSLAASDPVKCPARAVTAVAAILKETKVQKKAAIELASRYVRIASHKGQPDMEKAWRAIQAQLQPENEDVQSK